jgi:hypothetical protein
MEANDKLPEHLRVGGIEVTIWRALNTGFATVTLQRNYKNKNNEWQKTNSLRLNDLPKAILALQKAYELLVVKEE